MNTEVKSIHFPGKIIREKFVEEGGGDKDVIKKY